MRCSAGNINSLSLSRQQEPWGLVSVELGVFPPWAASASFKLTSLWGSAVKTQIFLCSHRNTQILSSSGQPLQWCQLEWDHQASFRPLNPQIIWFLLFLEGTEHQTLITIIAIPKEVHCQSPTLQRTPFIDSKTAAQLSC